MLVCEKYWVYICINFVCMCRSVDGQKLVFLLILITFIKILMIKVYVPGCPCRPNCSRVHSQTLGYKKKPQTTPPHCIQALSYAIEPMALHSLEDFLYTVWPCTLRRLLNYSGLSSQL